MYLLDIRVKYLKISQPKKNDHTNEGIKIGTNFFVVSWWLLLQLFLLQISKNFTCTQARMQSILPVILCSKLTQDTIFNEKQWPMVEMIIQLDKLI